MDTTTSVLLTGMTVVGGRMAQISTTKGKVKGPAFTARIVVGLSGLAILLSVLDESNPKLASQLAMLVLVTAVLSYGVPLVSAVWGK